MSAFRAQGGGVLVIRTTLLALVTLSLGLVAAPPAAAAQQPAKIPRIGTLQLAGQEPQIEAFREGLRQLGYVEGQNVSVEYRVTGEVARLPELAAELVRLKVDVIVAAGTPAAQAAKQATTTIPIVMLGVGDPVGTGLVASLARPGGNVTGSSTLGPETGAKRLQLLKEVIPKLSRVAFLWNPANPANILTFKEIQVAARTLALKLESVEVSSPDEFDRALTGMMAKRPNAFIMTADPMHRHHIRRIVDFLARRRLPAMYQMREHVEAGGLMSYGTSYPALSRRAATYVDKILKGRKPADLPVEQPTRFELVINMKTAKALGLTFPPSILIRADQVIQ